MLTYVPTFMKATRRRDLELDYVKMLCIELKPKKGRNILLTVACHPPGCGKAPDFFQNISKSIAKSLQEYKEVVLTGDLNCQQAIHSPITCSNSG